MKKYWDAKSPGKLNMYKASDATEDADNDGLTNIEEINGTWSGSTDRFSTRTNPLLIYSTFVKGLLNKNSTAATYGITDFQFRICLRALDSQKPANVSKLPDSFWVPSPTMLQDYPWAGTMPAGYYTWLAETVTQLQPQPPSITGYVAWPGGFSRSQIAAIWTNGNKWLFAQQFPRMHPRVGFGFSDLDSDDMPNAWEHAYGLNFRNSTDAGPKAELIEEYPPDRPTAYAAAAKWDRLHAIDPDHDGLSNLLEYAVQSNPTLPDFEATIDRDTDKDKISDIDEILYGSNPLLITSVPPIQMQLWNTLDRVNVLWTSDPDDPYLTADIPDWFVGEVAKIGVIVRQAPNGGANIPVTFTGNLAGITFRQVGTQEWLSSPITVTSQDTGITEIEVRIPDPNQIGLNGTVEHIITASATTGVTRQIRVRAATMAWLVTNNTVPPINTGGGTVPPTNPGSGSGGSSGGGSGSGAPNVVVETRTFSASGYKGINSRGGVLGESGQWSATPRPAGVATTHDTTSMKVAMAHKGEFWRYDPSNAGSVGIGASAIARANLGSNGLFNINTDRSISRTEMRIRNIGALSSTKLIHRVRYPIFKTETVRHEINGVISSTIAYVGEVNVEFIIYPNQRESLIAELTCDNLPKEPIRLFGKVKS